MSQSRGVVPLGNARSNSSRRGALRVLTVSVALVAASLTFTEAPAATPCASPPTVFPESSITPGMAGTGPHRGPGERAGQLRHPGHRDPAERAPAQLRPRDLQDHGAALVHRPGPRGGLGNVRLPHLHRRAAGGGRLLLLRPRRRPHDRTFHPGPADGRPDGAADRRGGHIATELGRCHASGPGRRGRSGQGPGELGPDHGPAAGHPARGLGPVGPASAAAAVDHRQARPALPSSIGPAERPPPRPRRSTRPPSRRASL